MQKTIPVHGDPQNKVFGLKGSVIGTDLGKLFVKQDKDTLNVGWAELTAVVTTTSTPGPTTTTTEGATTTTTAGATTSTTSAGTTTSTTSAGTTTSTTSAGTTTSTTSAGTTTSTTSAGTTTSTSTSPTSPPSPTTGTPVLPSVSVAVGSTILWEDENLSVGTSANGNGTNLTSHVLEEQSDSVSPIGGTWQVWQSVTPNSLTNVIGKNQVGSSIPGGVGYHKFRGKATNSAGTTTSSESSEVRIVLSPTLSISATPSSIPNDGTKFTITPNVNANGSGLTLSYVRVYEKSGATSGGQGSWGVTPILNVAPGTSNYNTPFEWTPTSGAGYYKFKVVVGYPGLSEKTSGDSNEVQVTSGTTAAGTTTSTTSAGGGGGGGGDTTTSTTSVATTTSTGTTAAPQYFTVIVNNGEGGLFSCFQAAGYDPVCVPEATVAVAGVTHTLFAVPVDGYVFSHWSGTGIINPSSATTGVIISNNATYTSNFVLASTTSTTSAGTTSAGTTTSTTSAGGGGGGGGGGTTGTTVPAGIACYFYRNDNPTTYDGSVTLCNGGYGVDTIIPGGTSAQCLRSPPADGFVAVGISCGTYTPGGGGGGGGGGETTSTTEAGTTEAGTTAAGTTEAGTTEAGTTAAGTTEAGTTEAGTTAAGTTEAGTTEAGTTAAGTTEAGTTEAGTTEAGTTEAGTTEAGTTEAGTTETGTTYGGFVPEIPEEEGGPGGGGPGTVAKQFESFP